MERTRAERVQENWGSREGRGERGTHKVEEMNWIPIFLKYLDLKGGKIESFVEDRGGDLGIEGKG